MTTHTLTLLTSLLLAGTSLVPAVTLAGTATPVAAKTNDTALPPRLQALLARMTLPEKIDLIRGTEEAKTTNLGEAGYLPGVPRLGIQPIRLADGPPGVLVSRPSMAEVATMGLAATFDTTVARRNGMMIADEARRLGIDVVLQPFINIDRDIAFTRSYNTFGEDPMLTGAMGAAQVIGSQSRGVMAQAKHYVAYDSDAIDIRVDNQALHEIYVAPFRDVVDAGVSSIMCSYNKVNGDWACGNKSTLTGILRNELHFKGFVTSDWGAVHGNHQVPAGMDMEMPGTLPDSNPFAGILPAYSDITPAPHIIPRPDFGMFTRVFISGMPEEPAVHAPDWEKTFPINTSFANLSEAMADGSVTMADIDRAAGRVLLQLDRFGKVAGGVNVTTTPIMSFEELDAINLDTARKAAVLLKNEDHVLPLTTGDLAHVALIGPGAAQLVAIGKASERSLGMPDRQVSPFAALKEEGGGNAVLAIADDMTGQPIPASALTLTHAGDPVPATKALDFTQKAHQALAPGGHHSWEGQLRIDAAGSYWLGVQMMGVRASLYLDGKRVAGSTSFPGTLHGDTVQANQDSLLPTHDGLDNVRALTPLSAGMHTVKVESEPDGSGLPEQIRLAWSTPAMQQGERDAAVAAARKAGKAVVFAWSRNAPVFHLPGDQDSLIEAVAAANPNTVVVLNTSQPVAMPWLGKVKGVLQMWWSGDKGGEATADLLTGRVSPGGRLPFTWGRRLEDYPATDPAHPERSAKGVNGVTTYSEGIDVGYRWFDRQKIAPTFAFGDGLSYTSFAYSGLKVSATADGGADVAFTLRNTGAVTGDEVPQIYLGAPKDPVPGAAFAIKALAGFSRISLAPGEARNVSLHLPARRFEYWSMASNKWQHTIGARSVQVGAASDDIRLSGTVTTVAPR